MSDTDLRELIRDPQYWRRSPEGEALRAKVARAFSERYPGPMRRDAQAGKATAALTGMWCMSAAIPGGSRMAGPTPSARMTDGPSRAPGSASRMLIGGLKSPGRKARAVRAPIMDTV